MVSVLVARSSTLRPELAAILQKWLLHDRLFQSADGDFDCGESSSRFSDAKASSTELR